MGQSAFDSCCKFKVGEWLVIATACSPARSFSVLITAIVLLYLVFCAIFFILTACCFRYDAFGKVASVFSSATLWLHDGFNSDRS